MQPFRHWPSAPTAVHGMYITPFAVNAVTTEANWRSTKTWQSDTKDSPLSSAHIHTIDTTPHTHKIFSNAMKAAPDMHIRSRAASFF